MLRPIRTIKALRAFNAAKREAEKAAAGGEFFPDDVESNGMAQEFALLLLRHGLTYAGGAAVLTDSELAQIVGAASTVLGLVWSAYRKWKRVK